MREELVEGEPVVEGETRDVVDADLLGELLEDRPRDDGGRLLLKDGLRDVTVAASDESSSSTRFGNFAMRSVASSRSRFCFLACWMG